MTQEEKDLLLKDLCARLPYGVKATTTLNGWSDAYIVTGYNGDKIYLDCPVYGEGNDEWDIESVKPYLRPMFSMTDEEVNFLFEHLPYDFTRIYSGEFDLEDIHFRQNISIDDMAFLLDCLNKWHFDYRGLIEKGLAIEAPEGMYIYK